MKICKKKNLKQIDFIVENKRLSEEAEHLVLRKPDRTILHVIDPHQSQFKHIHIGAPHVVIPRKLIEERGSRDLESPKLFVVHFEDNLRKWIPNFPLIPNVKDELIKFEHDFDVN